MKDQKLGGGCTGSVHFSEELRGDNNEEVYCVYYFADDCYIVREAEGDAFSDDQIAQFKEKNDWNQPLDEKRMSCVAYEPWHSNIVYDDDFEAIVLDYFGLDEEQYFVMQNGLEINEAGQQLFYCCICYSDEEMHDLDSGRSYLLVYQNDKKCPIVAIEECELTMDCQDTVRAFREKWFTP